MNKYLLLIILLVTSLTGARAQYDSQLSQYFMALGYYNPAYAGVTGDLNMLALSRLQYVGIDGAPTSFFINAKGHVIAQAVGAIDGATLQKGIDMIVD